MSYPNRLCLVTDIKGYSTHTVPEQADAQQRLARAMRFTCHNAGIRWISSKDRQDRGDGRLYVFSPQLDAAVAIPQLVNGLRHGLYETNREPGPFGRLRLRAAMARGIVGYGATGYIGQAPITACRLVDAQPLKDRFQDADASDLALIVTDELFHDVIKQGFPGLDASEFTEMAISVKEFSGTGWAYLPAAGPVLAPGQSDALWSAVLLGGAASVGAGTLTWVVLSARDGDPLSDDLAADSGGLLSGEHEHGEGHGEPGAEEADPGTDPDGDDSDHDSDDDSDDGDFDDGDFDDGGDDGS